MYINSVYTLAYTEFFLSLLHIIWNCLWLSKCDFHMENLISFSSYCIYIWFDINLLVYIIWKAHNYSKMIILSISYKHMDKNFIYISTIDKDNHSLLIAIICGLMMATPVSPQALKTLVHAHLCACMLLRAHRSIVKSLWLKLIAGRQKNMESPSVVFFHEESKYVIIFVVKYLPRDNP